MQCIASWQIKEITTIALIRWYLFVHSPMHLFVRSSFSTPKYW